MSRLQKKTNRIYIIGGPGSGKSYAAKILAKKLHITLLELDSIFWHKKDTNYTKKAPEKERNRKLKRVLDKKNWIIEGGYTKWVSPIIRSADTIIILNTHPLLRSARIIRRTVKRRLTNDGKENILAVIKLMRFNHQFEKVHIKRIQDDLKTCKAEIITFKKADDAISHILHK